MSPDTYSNDDDIPEFIREFIKNFANQFKAINPEDMTEAFKRLNSMDPNELENMLKNMFGEDFVEKFNTLGENFFENMGENFDPSIFSNIKQFKFDMKDFSFTPVESTPKEKKNIVIEEAAYFEIIDKSDSEKEIIVDLPGITDQRQIHWEVIGGDLKLDANATDLKYHAIIPLPDNITIMKHLSHLKNSIFILPFRSNE